MTKWLNGEIVDMTTEEIAAIQEQQAAYEAYERHRPLTAEEVTALLIRKQINTLEVDDNTALRMTEFYPEWASDTAYPAGYKVQYGGTLYKVLTAHTSQDDWTPDITPALFVIVSLDEWPEFVQPTGAHDAYNKGDKVTFEGKHYISLIDGNVYSPTAYPAGWQEQA